jgi:catechol 2,3-dioxygenase-like lactoylglutathione lyase family enzyme
MTSRLNWSLSSVLLFVSDLDRSVRFYRDVFDLEEIVREPEVALLGSDVAGSFGLDLRQADRHGFRAGRQALGLRACSFYVGSSAELDRIESRLKALSAFQDRQERGEGSRVEMVRGLDPDRLPLAFVGCERPLTSAEHRDAFSLIYSWES